MITKISCRVCIIYSVLDVSSTGFQKLVFTMFLKSVQQTKYHSAYIQVCLVSRINVV